MSNGEWVCVNKEEVINRIFEAGICGDHLVFITGIPSCQEIIPKNLKESLLNRNEVVKVLNTNGDIVVEVKYKPELSYHKNLKLTSNGSLEASIMESIKNGNIEPLNNISGYCKISTEDLVKVIKGVIPVSVDLINDVSYCLRSSAMCSTLLEKSSPFPKDSAGTYYIPDNKNKDELVCDDRNERQEQKKLTHDGIELTEPSRDKCINKAEPENKNPNLKVDPKLIICTNQPVVTSSIVNNLCNCIRMIFVERYSTNDDSQIIRILLRIVDKNGNTIVKPEYKNKLSGYSENDIDEVTKGKLTDVRLVKKYPLEDKDGFTKTALIKMRFSPAANFDGFVGVVHANNNSSIESISKMMSMFCAFGGCETIIESQLALAKINWSISGDYK